MAGISPSELQAFINATYANDPATANVRRVVVPKKYGITFPAIALASTVTQVINISANGDFFLTRITYRASLAGAAQQAGSVPVPNLRCLFTDSASDEQWSNQAIDLSQWGMQVGGEMVLELPYPRVINGRASVNVSVTSFEAASTPVLDLTLDGVLAKVFG